MYELTTLDDMNKTTGRAISTNFADLTQAADQFEHNGHRVMLCEFYTGKILRLTPLR